MTVTEPMLRALAGRRLFVGAPMYDDRCHSAFAFSMIRLTDLCARSGIALRFHFECDQALVTKARNRIADAFLHSGDDCLLFVDADIGFDPRDALHLMAIQLLDEAGVFDIVAAPYPLKRIDWRRVARAAAAGVGTDDPAALERCCGEIRIDPVGGAGDFRLDRPLEVIQAGTGFMMVRRATFATLAARDPARRYRRDPDDDDGSSWVHAFFETGIDSRRGDLGEALRTLVDGDGAVDRDALRALLDDDGDADGRHDGRHISEDYAFCRRARAAGMRVWLCPWMALTHTGTYRFASRVADLGAVGGGRA